jgi:hypothetical protein
MKNLFVYLLIFLNSFIFAQEALQIDESGNIFIIVEGVEINLQEYLAAHQADLTPAGSIQSFAGKDAPEGWLICDGSLIDKNSNSEYTALVDLLRDAAEGVSNHPYIVNTSDTQARLPDFRGRFLRGVDDSEGNDPDAEERTNEAGTIVGDHVGTIQDDAFQGHWHMFHFQPESDDEGGPIAFDQISDAPNPNAKRSDRVQDPIWDGKNGTPRTSSETRPENVSVNFIIKY